MDSLEDMWQKYQKFVQNRTDLVSQIESVVRCLSYILPARFENSTLISELMFSASNLLVLLNDVILRRTIKKHVGIHISKLQQLLSVLDAVEVFMELSSERVLGSIARWAVIVSIQIAKAVIRLLLLYKHGTGLQTSPAMPTLDRKAYHAAKNNNEEDRGSASAAGATISEVNDLLQPFSSKDTEETYILKRSGRRIRSLKSAPPVMYRTWKLPEVKKGPKDESLGDSDYLPTRLTPTQVKAELLHIVRPLLHLLGLYVCGQSSWKPWILACGMDVSSLCLMGEPAKFTPPEQAELRRRTYLLILYILRSPFYDRISKAKVLLLLHMMTSGVPAVGWLAKPLADYLPVWQKIYSYVWSV